MQLWQYCVF